MLHPGQQVSFDPTLVEVEQELFGLGVLSPSDPVEALHLSVVQVADSESADHTVGEQMIKRFDRFFKCDLGCPVEHVQIEMIGASLSRLFAQAATV